MMMMVTPTTTTTTMITMTTPILYESDEEADEILRPGKNGSILIVLQRLMSEQMVQQMVHIMHLLELLHILPARDRQHCALVHSQRRPQRTGRPTRAVLSNHIVTCKQTIIIYM